MSREGDELLYSIGEALGYALAPMIKGLLDGAEDRRINEAAMQIDEEAAEQEIRSEIKTQIRDCEKCLCGYCERTEICSRHYCASCKDGAFINSCEDYIRNKDGSFNMG